MGAREAIVLCIIYSETVVNNRISQVGERVESDALRKATVLLMLWDPTVR